MGNSLDRLYDIRFCWIFVYRSTFSSQFSRLLLQVSGTGYLIVKVLRVFLVVIKFSVTCTYFVELSCGPPDVPNSDVNATCKDVAAGTI